jgi:hypothetical protein
MEPPARPSSSFQYPIECVPPGAGVSTTTAYRWVPARIQLPEDDRAPVLMPLKLVQ